MDDASLPIFEFSDGRRFVTTARHHPGGSPFETVIDGKTSVWSEDEMLQFCSSMWHEAFDARRAELERLKQNSLFYDGFHYVNAWMNRVNAITNRVYEIVEQQVALSISGNPRPEIVARGWDDTDRADRLQAYAEALQDTAEYDQAIYLGARDKHIFGYNIWLVSGDYATGMPYAKNYSVFDFYPDPAGRNEDECHYFVLAAPQGTHRLRATYPDKADQIEPDHIASPAHEVTVKPWREFLENAGGSYSSPMSPDSALPIWPEGDSGNRPATGVSLVADTGSTREYGLTTFVLQFLIADDELVPVTYEGQWDDGTTASFTNPEPRCGTGWWLVSYGSNGVLLHDPHPIDEAYLGLPFVIDRSQQRTDRFESTSEVDQILPIQREHNRRKALMMRALEIAANPPVKATAGHGMQADKGTVSAGELLTINRGSTLEYMEFTGPSSAQFDMLAAARSDLQAVAGVPDVQEGVKPAGVQAAAAIRRLDDNSMRRMNAKENPARRARELLLRKLMYYAGKKSDGTVTFVGPSGVAGAVDPHELCSAFSVRYASGSGTPDGRADLRDTSVLLFDKGILDAQGVLDTYQWPGRGKVIKRLAKAQEQRQALAGAGVGGAPGSAPGGAAGGGGAPPIPLPGGLVPPPKSRPGGA